MSTLDFNHENIAKTKDIYNMASWSAENATNAYIQTLKGRRGKEPGAAEFIAALAAGNSAQLIVVASAGCAESTVLALGAAAKETGGHAVCILQGTRELKASMKVARSANMNADLVEFVVGDARSLLLEEFRDADFVLVDCRMDECSMIMEAGQRQNAIVVGYNALRCAFPRVNGLRAQFLPIGEGLLMVTGTSPSPSSSARGARRGKPSRWVVRVDQYSGEEHIYRITVKQ